MFSPQYLLKVAEAGKNIVSSAAIVAKKIQKQICSQDIVAKADTSPVTMVDYAIQTSIALYLQKTFPSQEFRMIAEEDASYLRNGASPDYIAKFLNVVQEILNQEVSIQDALAALDNCHYQGDISNDYWILDPIDGTLGFIHKAQFAIGLAYVHNGIPVVGVVGCPNLSFDLNAIQWNENVDQCGSVAVGISGMGTTFFDLFSSRTRSIRLQASNNPPETTLSSTLNPNHPKYSAVTSVQKVNHASTMSSLLNALQLPSSILEIDSMCKYVVVALGIADIYLRGNAQGLYKENVWDHAAGVVVLQEAGGIVTDQQGKALDFSKGAKLKENSGIVATNSEIHDMVTNVLTNLYNDSSAPRIP